MTYNKQHWWCKLTQLEEVQQTYYYCRLPRYVAYSILFQAPKCNYLPGTRYKILLEIHNPTLTRGFHTATETPLIRDDGTPDVPPLGRVGAVGIGKGPAILSKFIVSSFKMSVFDNARLRDRGYGEEESGSDWFVSLAACCPDGTSTSSS